MNQRTRALVSMLVMFGLAAAAGLYAWFGVFKAQEAEKTAKEQKAKIFDFDKAKVKVVTVTAKGTTTVINAVDKEQWAIVSPVQTPADKPTIDALVNQLTQMKSKAVIEENSKDLAKFGLEKPTAKVTVRLEGAPDLVLRVGTENPYDNSVYIATGDSKDVIQAEGNFKWAVDKDLFDLRDKRVMPFDEPQVKSVTWRNGETQFALEKKDGRWVATSPFTGPADEATANKVVNALKNMRANKFPTDTFAQGDAAKYGLDAPKLDASVALDNGAVIDVQVGQVDEGGTKKTYAKLKKTTSVAEVYDTVLTDTHPTPLELKDKAVASFEKDKVYGVKVALGPESLTLARPAAVADGGSPDDWNITDPANLQAKKWKVNSMLFTLSGLKATAFVDESGAPELAKYGLDKPSRTVTLLDRDGKEVAGFAFGSDVNSNVHVMNTLTKKVYEVEKSRLGDLPNGKADLVDAPAATPDGGTH